MYAYIYLQEYIVIASSYVYNMAFCFYDDFLLILSYMLWGSLYAFGDYLSTYFPICVYVFIFTTIRLILCLYYFLFILFLF